MTPSGAGGQQHPGRGLLEVGGVLRGPAGSLPAEAAPLAVWLTLCVVCEKAPVSPQLCQHPGTQPTRRGPRTDRVQKTWCHLLLWQVTFPLATQN